MLHLSHRRQPTSPAARSAGRFFTLTLVRRAALPLLLLLTLASPPARAQGTNFVTQTAIHGAAVDRNGNIWITHLTPDGAGVVVRQYAPTGGNPLRTVTLTGFWPVTIETEPMTGFIWGVESQGRVIKINPTTGAVATIFNLRTLSTDICHIYDAASGSTDCFGGLISPNSASYGDLSFWTDPSDGTRYLFVAGNSTAFPFITRMKLTNDTPSGARVIVSSRASAAPQSNQPRGVAAAYDGFLMTTLPLGGVGGTFDRPFAFYGLFDLEGIFEPAPISDTFVDSRGAGADAAGGFYIATGVNGTTFCPSSGDVLYISPDFTSGTCYSLLRTVSNSRDAAVSSTANALYVPVIDQNRLVKFTTPDLCSYEVLPEDEDFTSAGGTGTLDVFANGACPWAATSSATWITVNTGRTGAGDGEVTYTVAANTTTAARAGTITVAGQTVLIQQAGVPCTYTINPTSRTLTSKAAATGSVTVTALAGCAWTAASNNTSWLTVTAGATGSGNGTVSYSAAANTGLVRTGTITIAGQTFSLTQPGDPAAAIRVDSLTPRARRAAGGQQLTLTGAFVSLQSVTVDGTNAAWTYVNGTGTVAVTTPAHAVGAVGVSLVDTNGGTTTLNNAFAYLPTVFTDDALVAGMTPAKAQHVLELRQAVDALRLVAGLAPAVWQDPALDPASAPVKAAHVTQLRTSLEEAAARLGFAPQTYTDPDLGAGSQLKRVHVEELRQRVRQIAG